MASISGSKLLSLDNPVFRAYLLHSSILAFKIIVMPVLTIYQRFKHRAFMNPEDAQAVNTKPKTHEDVERVKRAHLNDLENIYLFYMTGFMYVLSDPALLVAKGMFLIFTSSRILHTYVYAINVYPQPTRSIVWGIGYLVIVYMAAIAFVEFF